jgi:hypothetical protein
MRIHDPARNLDRFDTKQLLDVILPLCGSLRWRVSQLEVIQERDDAELERVEESGSSIDAETLSRLFGNVYQTIEGTVDGYVDGADVSTVTIRAVDSTWFDVESSDEAVIREVEAKFFPTWRFTP